ncbi:MAG: MaoC family dehydratase N-terminal domain-containing protein [Dehalococcoidia bacterium]|nr:MaoC family dehydratase N-terminal domain-containing protein [Dehalococcoidia bacterium]MCA9844401.1 MaoC family dehydratase N-terminal domain-containing protein [Dehalococcoidia bacterium]MCA9854024.1 MaoC family dehydratase N-terminal domain-containing protein [Dehalococcoidia bacterium]
MTEPTESLIKDEHRAVIGQKGDPVKVVVSGDDARRMRDLLEDDDPRWADGTGIAPPYVLSGLAGGRPRGQVPQILPNGILTQTEWQFHKPFKIDEELEAVGQVFDIRDRLGGRYGYSILVMTGTEYYNSAGDLVASSIMTITQFDPAGLKR